MADPLHTAWHEIEQLVGREHCTPESTIDAVRVLVEQRAALRAEIAELTVERDRFESLAEDWRRRALEADDERRRLRDGLMGVLGLHRVPPVEEARDDD